MDKVALASHQVELVVDAVQDLGDRSRIQITENSPFLHSLADVPE